MHENDDKYRYYCTLSGILCRVSHLKLTGLPFGPDLSFTLNMPLTPKASAACISLLPSKWQLVHSTKTAPLGSYLYQNASVCVRKQLIAYERARRAACPKGYESPAGARKRVVARSTFVLK